MTDLIIAGGIVVAAVLAGVGAGIWTIRHERARNEYLRAGGAFPPELPPGYDGWFDAQGVMPPPIHWRLADHEPPPVIVHMTVDTAGFTEAMRGVGVSIAELERRRKGTP